MDGVLWYSSQAHSYAYDQVFKSVGIHHPPDYSVLAGRETYEVILDILNKFNIELPVTNVATSIEELVTKKRSLARNILQKNPPVVPGSVDFLRKCAKRYVLALASSASTASVQLFLDVTSSADLFALVVTGEDVAQAKPSPQIYTNVLDRLGVLAKSALVFEDAISGVNAAHAAGIRVVGVASSLSHADFSSLPVIDVINTFSDVVWTK